LHLSEFLKGLKTPFLINVALTAPAGGAPCLHPLRGATAPATILTFALPFVRTVRTARTGQRYFMAEICGPAVAASGWRIMTRRWLRGENAAGTGAPANPLQIAGRQIHL